METPDDVRQLADKAMTQQENGADSTAHERWSGKKNETAEHESSSFLVTLAKVADKEDKKIDFRNTLKMILRGEFLGSPAFRKELPLIGLIVVCSIIYISNRYACDAQVIEVTRLQDTLKDRRFKTLTVMSQLKNMMRPSHIEEHVKDTALQRSVEPVYSLKVSGEREGKTSE